MKKPDAHMLHVLRQLRHNKELVEWLEANLTDLSDRLITARDIDDVRVMQGAALFIREQLGYIKNS